MQKDGQVEAYAALAAGYDEVMAHVAYDDWARYAHARLSETNTGVCDVLELGCGTGSLAVRLQPMGPYRYTATDGQPAMLRVAREKADAWGVPVTFRTAQFTDFEADAPIDAVVLLYDGLNYLLEEAQVQQLFACARAALRPGGLFLFDQSTPANSEDNADFFSEVGRTEAFSYVRQSRYDPASRLHTTTFEISVDGQMHREEHVQRAYSVAAVRRLLQEGGLAEVAAYDDFSTKPATERSHRVHWLARRP